MSAISWKGDIIELLQVFDINKKVLNESIERSRKSELPSGKYFMIILLFIQNKEGKFLIQKTSKNRKSEYATTGGHVTYGDNSIETLIKEAKEELDIQIDKKDVIFIDTITYKYCHCDIYYCNKDLKLENLKLQSEEVESIDWLSEKEIRELISQNKFRKGNIEPFQKVLSKIK